MVCLRTSNQLVPPSDMPDAPSHKTVHTNKYYFTDLLDRTAMLPNARKEGVLDILGEVGEALQNGTFPLKSRISAGGI